MNGTQINCKDELVKEFGGSKEFINSVSQALQGETDCPTNLSNSLEAAYQVAECDYESNTNRGEKVGWLYGSKSKDVLIGLMIHKRVLLSLIEPTGLSRLLLIRRWAGINDPTKKMGHRPT
ncbi:hypothetical protein LWI29_006530 [Acer saccharum]|uniref:Uncharacterized protein n=1 Tax=Acer saccharum TaxID=4024 RepID=A0AA39SEZ2_ACESA|nr:hypothetical protein LWI29_006530 [Acer saccharum]